MGRIRVRQGSTFEEEFAYVRAVAAGPWVFVSGTTGFDYSTMTIADDAAAQTEQALANIDAALAEVGAHASDIVRVHYYLPDGDEFAACAPALRAYFGDAPPAATMVVCDLIDDRIRIEIEVTALRQST